MKLVYESSCVDEHRHAGGHLENAGLALPLPKEETMPTNENISRRTWLTKLMLLMAAAGLSPKQASATEGKVGKSVVHYRDHPKDGQMCGNCKYFVGGGMMGGGMMGGGMMAGECQVVKGRISPMGWCDLYAGT
jgi:hypothetical protein